MRKGELGCFSVNDAAQIGEIILESQAQARLAQSELEECNKKQEDLLHTLELSNLGARELTKVARELRDVRRKRRIAKNTLELVRPLNEWADSYGSAINRLYNTIGKMRRIVKEQSTAVYHFKSVEGEVIEHADCYDNSQSEQVS